MAAKSPTRYQPRRAKGTTETHHLITYILLPAIPLVLLGLFHLLSRSRSAMDWLIRYVTNPYKRGMSWLMSWIPISVAELCYGIAIVAGILFLVRTIVLLIRRSGRLARLARRLIVLASAFLIFYTGYTYLWGANFYGTTFAQQAELVDRGATAEELYQLTSSFALEANHLATTMVRDENGVFTAEVKDIFADSGEIYDGISEEYPFLAGYSRTPKSMITSRLFSYMGFTGFYFPFTGESTLNVDAPICLLPATVAHELSHQRGVANEDEANFVAILTCLRSDNEIYQYSGCLLGYIHLSNALYKADKALWQQVYDTLNDSVLADLNDNNSYWSAIGSTSAGATATEVSSSLYTSFASGYGEEDVMQKYEACVDLLVAYYFDGQ
jgi:hypothetical protein